MDNYQELAQRLLVHRKQGYSISYIMQRSSRRYLVLSIVLIVLVIFALLEQNATIRALAMFGIGLVLGALIRDIGWFRAIKQMWPFTSEVTDWAKVEAIAAGEAGATPPQATSP